MVTALAKGRDVFDGASGKKLGRVAAVYLDPERRKVVGLSVRKGGIFGGAPAKMIELRDVRILRTGAVLVPRAASVGHPINSALAAGLLDLDALIGRPVETDDGAGLGRLAAIRFGVENGRLAAIEVEPDGLPLCRLLLGADQIVTLGRNAVVVHEPPVVPSRPATRPPVRVLAGDPGPRRVA